MKDDVRSMEGLVAEGLVLAGVCCLGTGLELKGGKGW